MKSIGIVGGGIIGLSTAASILQDNPGVKIVVYSDVFSPHTTGDVSAGLILPYLWGPNDNLNTLKNWMRDTIKHLQDFSYENEEASKAVAMISGYLLWKETNDPTYPFRDCFTGWRNVPRSELDLLFRNTSYAHGSFLTTYQCDCSIYLPCVMKKLVSKGVQFVEKKILSLDEVADIGHDIVVNTTGFYATYLTSDQEMNPYKGHILTANAPWVKHFFLEADGDSYVIPKSSYLVVGGTHDADTSPTLDKDTSKKIWNEACQMTPSLRAASLIGERVGIRPGRSSVRIEMEQATSKSGKKYAILHHYGHGGFGVTVHWGSAKEASSVLKSYLAQHARL